MNKELIKAYMRIEELEKEVSDLRSLRFDHEERIKELEVKLAREAEDAENFYNLFHAGTRYVVELEDRIKELEAEISLRNAR